MSNNNQDKSKYPLTVSPLYKFKNGYQSITINDTILTALQQSEAGGKLIIKVNQTKSEDSSSHTPDAFLEYLNPAQVAERLEAYKKAKNSKAAQNSI